MENSIKNLFCGDCTGFIEIQMHIIGYCDNEKSKFAQMVLTSRHPGCPEHRKVIED